MTKRRVVITGMGVVSPFGVGADKLWDGVVSGKSAISKIENMGDMTGHTVLIGGEIKESVFNPVDYFEPKEAKRLDKFLQYSIVAAREAVSDSGIKESDIDPYRLGVIVGSAAGGFHTIEKSYEAMLNKGPTKCSPFTIPMLICDMCAGKISIEFGAKGVNKAIVTACATAAHCIGDAFRTIQYGEADAVIAGGSEAAICTIGLGAFTAAKTLSKRNDEPTKASRPYDKDRDGFVMAEGAGVLVLEELEHAKKRGAKIYAEIIGYGQTGDAYDVVAPHPEGLSAAKAMELALKDAGIEPKDVQYINTHGTSTHLGDIAETKAIANVFGDRTSNPNLRVSSTKSETGHMLGASGAAESVICIKAINNDIVPPTINLDNLDDEVADLNYVPNKAEKMNVDVALTNSFGFGGHNAVLIYKKYN
ncbi:TPA: beta-ketoacyl-ACP synthase II [Candidatus Avigastranaerophilus faecigallinarum]|nr:beta-ketoacyl-ACP synthase II [Candidatus Avigastranaerophilus faecigallinarum]